MDKPDFVLYAYECRTRAERVLWVLNELQFDYQLIRLNPFEGNNKSAELLKLNSQGKVPILTYKNNTYTDSLAIMEYLVDISNKPTLIPSNAEGNYRFRSFICYMLTEVEAYLWIADQSSRLSSVYSWPEGTYDESMMRVNKSIPHMYSFISDTGFSMGENFTIADIYAYHILTWAIAQGINHPANIMSYLQRLESLSSCPEEMKQYDNKYTA